MISKKGQIGIGTIMVVFISILIGVIFVQTIAQQVGSSTNTVVVANDSLGTVLNNSEIYLTDYKAISDVVIINTTGEDVVADTEYTITNDVVYNGALAVLVTVDADDGDGQTGNEWSISGTAEPLTYISDGGGRAMAGLIVIMFALAVLVVALEPTLRGNILEMMGK